MNRRRHPRRRHLLLWGLPLAYMALIFVVSSATWGVSIPAGMPFQDKGVHFLEYGVLGFLCAHAARASWASRPPMRSLLFGALIALGWGLLDELHQAFVPGRDADVFDLLADALGALAGATARFGLEKIWPARFVPARVSSAETEPAHALNAQDEDIS